jgi:hypothetical protein
MAEFIKDAKAPDIPKAYTPINTIVIISKKNKQKTKRFHISLFLVHPFFSKVRF